MIETSRRLFAERLAEASQPLQVGQAFDAAEGTLLILGVPGETSDAPATRGDL
jgi:hypothetical protein